NWVRRPEPIGDIRIIERRDAKVGAVEPEPLPVASCEMKYVAGAEAKREVTMLPWMVQVEPCLIVWILVSDPLPVCMDVRSAGMPFHVMEVAMFFASGIYLRRRAVLRLPAPDRWGAVRRNVAAAHMAAVLFLSMFPPAFLRVNRNSQREACCD